MWYGYRERGSRYSENGGSMMYGESTAITWIAGFSRFRKTVSLAGDLAQPLQIDRRFDLALSLEVAEHLPPECGSEFVQTLTDLSSVILFSAAIPFQGGTDHLNEQWPEYWADRFDARGYVPIDCIRRRIWRNEDVEWWYAQNLMFFVRGR